MLNIHYKCALVCILFLYVCIFVYVYNEYIFCCFIQCIHLKKSHIFTYTHTHVIHILYTYTQAPIWHFWTLLTTSAVYGLRHSHCGYYQSLLLIQVCVFNLPLNFLLNFALFPPYFTIFSPYFDAWFLSYFRLIFVVI